MPHDLPQKARPFFLAVQEAKLAFHVIAGVRALRKWDDHSPVTPSDLAAAAAELHNIKLGG
jgi:hypothetical protein